LRYWEQLTQCLRAATEFCAFARVSGSLAVSCWRIGNRARIHARSRSSWRNNAGTQTKITAPSQAISGKAVFRFVTVRSFYNLQRPGKLQMKLEGPPLGSIGNSLATINPPPGLAALCPGFTPPFAEKRGARCWGASEHSYLKKFLQLKNCATRRFRKLRRERQKSPCPGGWCAVSICAEFASVYQP